MSSLEVGRERVIQLLCAQYANDALTTQELEARFAIAYAATSEVDLQAVLVNLPALPSSSSPLALTAPRPALPPSPARALRPVSPLPDGAVMVTSHEKRILAFMSETKKVGEWVPGRRNVVRAIMGTVHIDLREALLCQGEVEFDVTAIMGEVRFTVPPGLRVECEGEAIMGEFREMHLAGDEDPTAPLVRIHGSTLMGSVRIKSRLPGESGIAAWRRRRLERGTR